MTKTMELNQEWKNYLASHLEWVDGWINPGSEPKFQGPEGRVKLLQLIIDSGEISVEETVELQCLGTYLGQAIVEKTGWEWCVVKDEYGTDLGIQVPGKTAWLFPVTMISKRIEDGEDCDVSSIFSNVIPMALKVDAENITGSA